MDRTKLLRMLESEWEREAGSLNGNEELASLGVWDSLGVISLMALADRQLGALLDVGSLNECRTVDQLVELLAASRQREAA